MSENLVNNLAINRPQSGQLKPVPGRPMNRAMYSPRDKSGRNAFHF